MKLHISNENIIYTSEPIEIKGYSEYTGFEDIQVNPINDILVKDTIEHLLLIPSTHINNLWHLMHHLFVTYKFIIARKLDVGYIFPIFFKDFYRKQNSITNFIYKDLMFTGMGFNYEKFLELYTLFQENVCIDVKTVDVVNLDINFNNEPICDAFKLFIMNNLNISYTNSSDKRITFILRKGPREITNIGSVKNLLSLKIRYIYLEDYSIKEQLAIISNTDLLFGVHGAGLTWAIFMKRGSTLVEMYPGNSNTDNYSRWCKIAGINYRRLVVSINRNDSDFRNCTVKLTHTQINEIKKYTL